MAGNGRGLVPGVGARRVCGFRATRPAPPVGENVETPQRGAARRGGEGGAEEGQGAIRDVLSNWMHPPYLKFDAGPVTVK